jgi:hypothetical protein
MASAASGQLQKLHHPKLLRLQGGRFRSLSPSNFRRRSGVANAHQCLCACMCVCVFQKIFQLPAPNFLARISRESCTDGRKRPKYEAKKQLSFPTMTTVLRQAKTEALKSQSCA